MSARLRRRRAVLLLSVALVCGGLAASQVAGRMRAVEASVGAPVDVLVTAREVAPGTRLRREDLAVREVPSRFAPPDALTSAEEVIGLAAPTPIADGAYLTAGGLSANPAGPAPGGGSQPLRRGQRAVEVAVAGAGALGRSTAAGSRVDVLVSTDATQGSGRTLLALEDVELLDLKPGRATLRVTVGQAVYLTAAQNFAREVRLLPRPPGDRRRAGREAVAASGL